MKVSKILALLTIPFLLAGCGSSQGGSGGGGSDPTPTPTPDPDPDPEEKGIDFSKLSAEETKKYFTVDYDSIMSITTDQSMPLSKTCKSAVNTYESKRAILKKDDNYSLSGQNYQITKFNRNEAVQFVNESAKPTPEVTELTVEQYLQDLAAKQGGSYTLNDGVVQIKISSASSKYQNFIVGKVADNVKTLYKQQSDGQYYVLKQINLDPYEDFDLDELADYAKYSKYNSANKRYEVDVSKFPVSSQITYKSCYFTLHNDRISYCETESSVTHSGTTYEFVGKMSVSGATITFDLPTNIKTCAHKYSSNYYQELSILDGKYYHYYKCETCEDQKDHGECKFDVEGACEECKNIPYDDIELQLTKDKSDVLAYGVVNAKTRKLYSVIINFMLGDYTVIDQTKTLTIAGITPGEGESLIVTYAIKVGSTYNLLATLMKTNNPTKFYVIEGAKMTETEEAVSFTEGTATLYTEGQVIKE